MGAKATQASLVAVPTPSASSSRRTWLEQGASLGCTTGFGLGALPGVCLGASVDGLVSSLISGPEGARLVAISTLDAEQESPDVRISSVGARGLGAISGV